MRKISVSCTLTVFHDGRFWVGVVQRIEDGRLFASRIVFGAEPSNEEIEQLVLSRAWDRLCFPDLYDAASRMCEAAAGVASYGRAAEGCCAPVSSARDAGTGGFLASGAARIEVPSPPKNPKRRQRNVRKQMKRDAFACTKAQQALAEAREAAKDDRLHARSARKKADADVRFALRQEKRKRKHKGR